MSQSMQPILDGIRIASPCRADWNSMTGNDRRRFCSECGQHVHDISTLTTAEAVRVVAGPEPTPCIRFYRRADGTVLTADCPIGAGDVRRRDAVLTALLGVGVAVVSTVAVAVGFRREVDAAVATSSEPAESVVTAIKTWFGTIKAIYGLPAPELMMGFSGRRVVPLNPVPAAVPSALEESSRDEPICLDSSFEI